MACQQPDRMPPSGRADCRDGSAQSALHELEISPGAIQLADHRPDRRAARWPPADPCLATDAYFERLGDSLNRRPPDDPTWWRWSELAERVLEAVRPHCLDADAAACGSFASGTAIGAVSDVDVTLRIWEPPDAWGEAADVAVTDLKRWLSHSPHVRVEETGAGTVVAQALSGVGRLRVLLASPAGRSFDAVPALATCTDSHSWAWIPGDPLSHSARMRARDAALGGEVFAAAVRIVKHLARRWADTLGRPPVSSYLIDTLALEHLDGPFNLSEGTAEFLEFAAEATSDPAAAVGLTGDAPDGDSFASFCAQAARAIHGANAAEPEAEYRLWRLFGAPDETGCAVG